MKIKGKIILALAIVSILICSVAVQAEPVKEKHGRKHQLPNRPANMEQGQMEPGQMRPEQMDGQGFGRFAEMQDEYLEWLNKNYPDEAKELEKLAAEKPEMHRRKLMLSMRKYGKIAKASKDNPALAELLKKNLALKEKRNALLEEIKTADENKKAELTEQLRLVISERFDLILERKQMAYENLKKELENLKKEVEESNSEVEKWRNTKDEKVQKRLEELINYTEKFEWD